MTTYEQRQCGNITEHRHNGCDYWHPVTRIHVNDDVEHRLLRLERNMKNVQNKNVKGYDSNMKTKNNLHSKFIDTVCGNCASFCDCDLSKEKIALCVSLSIWDVLYK